MEMFNFSCPRCPCDIEMNSTSGSAKVNNCEPGNSIDVHFEIVSHSNIVRCSGTKFIAVVSSKLIHRNPTEVMKYETNLMLTLQH